MIEESICMGAMQLILPDGQVLSGESALPEILGRLKRYRLAAGLFRLPGSKILAGSFYQWFGGKGVKSLFLDGGKGVKSLFLNNLVYSLRKKLPNPKDLDLPLHLLEILVPGD